MRQKNMIAVALGLLLFAYFLLPKFFESSSIESIIFNQELSNQNMLKLESPAFLNGNFIPSKYTCDEAPPQGPYGFNPPLLISGVPEEAQSLVLLMDDPDVPKTIRPEGVFDHWVLYNIPRTATFFDEGKFEGVVGANGRSEAKYASPCPPTQYEPTTHRYFFKLYATDIPTLNFVKTPTKDEVLAVIQGHIIEEATLMGKYDRTKTAEENN